VQLIAEQALAWSVVLLLVGTNDDDDPWITGAEGSLKQANKEVGYRTRPPMSVWIGGKWHSYARVPEPFSTILGMTVDFTNSIRSGEPSKMASVPVDSLVGQMENKTFLKGLSDFYEAARGTATEGSTEGLTEWVSNFTVSWIPNIVRSTSREASGEYMNRRVWMTGDEWLKQLAKRTIQKTELHILKDFPIYDVWGRPAQRSVSPVGADWLYRILVPVRNQTGEIFVADRVILNWNNQQKEEESYPMTPPPYYESDGKTVRLDEQQYADFARLAGEAARYGLEQGAVTLDPEKPTMGQIKYIKDVCSESRSRTKDLLEKRWNGESVDVDSKTIGQESAKSVASNLIYYGVEPVPDEKKAKNDETYQEHLLERQKAIERLQEMKQSVPHKEAQKLLRARYEKATEAYRKRGEALAKLYGEKFEAGTYGSN